MTKKYQTLTLVFFLNTLLASLGWAETNLPQNSILDESLYQYCDQAQATLTTQYRKDEAEFYQTHPEYRAERAKYIPAAKTVIENIKKFRAKFLEPKQQAAYQKLFQLYRAGSVDQEFVANFFKAYQKTFNFEVRQSQLYFTAQTTEHLPATPYATCLADAKNQVAICRKASKYKSYNWYNNYANYLSLAECEAGRTNYIKNSVKECLAEDHGDYVRSVGYEVDAESLTVPSVDQVLQQFNNDIQTYRWESVMVLGANKPERRYTLTSSPYKLPELYLFQSLESYLAERLDKRCLARRLTASQKYEATFKITTAKLDAQIKTNCEELRVLKFYAELDRTKPSTPESGQKLLERYKNAYAVSNAYADQICGGKKID